MALLTPIIHCPATREPDSFHDDLRYAVNLAFEVPSDFQGDMTADEKAAAAMFATFLGALGTVRFYAYDENGHPWRLPTLSDQPGTADIRSWLADHAPKGGGRFWTTLATQDRHRSVDAETADASALLRSVQSWNAPVGHRIGLTHLVTIPDALKDRTLYILPHFADPPPDDGPSLPEGLDLRSAADKPVNAGNLPGLGFATHVAITAIGPGTPSPLPLDTSPETDPAGFLILSPEADAIARFLARFEERAPSLLATNAVLLPATPGALERDFGIDLKTMRWDRTARYVVARLVTALDTLVIALMKPGDAASEGELLAPLVTALLDEGAATDPGPALTAIRAALARSPLIDPAATPQAIARALRRVFGIEPFTPRTDSVPEPSGPPAPPDVPPGDLDALIALLLEDKELRRDGVIPDVAKAAAADLLDHTAASSAYRSIDLLSARLLAREQAISGEDGTERTLFRIFETAVDGTRTFPALLAEQLGTAPDLTVKALAAYRTMVEGPFNGAEAARRAAGAAYVKALVGTAGPGLGLAALRNQVVTADLFRRRLSPTYTPPNPVVAGLLPLDLHDPLPAPRLTDAYTRAVAPLLADPETGRFVPDGFPQPLPIQIASAMDAGTLDAFAHAFAGICVAIRRLDAPDSRWAHANLADLATFEPQAPASLDVRATLHPFLPGIVDGRSPMFIRYEGTPFADSAHEDALRPADDDQKTRPHPFYRHQPHAFPPTPDQESFQPTPQLAYGRRFESFAFAVTNAGTPPKPLQVPGTPWRPAPKIPASVTIEILRSDCSRRTPIAQMTLLETPNGTRPARLGESIQGVHPLAADYPRLGALATPGHPGVIDLFRDGDGQGRMALPTKDGEAEQWTLSDIALSTPDGTVALRLMDKAFATPDLAGTPIPLPAAGFTTLHLRIEKLASGGFSASIAAGDSNPAAFAIPPDARLCWLRLVLSPGTPAATISLADPDGRRPAAAALPLLLLAPDAHGTWKPGLSDKVELTLQAPRVGLADYLRWMANADLRAKACGAGTIAHFHFCLLVAARLRHLDHRLGKYLDRLPDPAITRILIEFHATDCLAPQNLVPDTRSLGLAGLIAPVLGKLPATKDLTPKVLIEKLFEPLDHAFTFNITLRPGPKSPSGTDGALTFRVPQGVVAKLALSAGVDAAHFTGSTERPSVFHTGMTQLATRTVTHEDRTEYLFPAGGLRIETMDDRLPAAPTALVARRIRARPLPGSRRFDIVASASPPEDRDTWRLLGEIDVATQRWRPTGRPIYHFIVPHAKAAEQDDRHAAVPLHDPDPDIDLFEREAFFDRSDTDAVTVTQRLAPLPAETVLQQHHWDPPSATYFRHRFTLRSRYAGALLKARSLDAWPRDVSGRAAAWTHRVAVLADAARLELTRPQLRSVIPLTTTPGGEDAGLPVPPVLAILQEPPFAHGGLADRIAAGFVTGFGYGFEQKKNQDGAIDSQEPVEILDSRKEIGPDPQLGYRPLDAATALGLALRVEGPVGLTFDDAGTATPAFPNTMLLMRPRSLNGAEPALQESLAGFALRRYIDPDWLAPGPARDTPGLPLDRTWWIDLRGPRLTLSYHEVPADPPANPTPPVAVLDISPTGTSTVIRTWKVVIDGVAGAVRKDVEVARIDAAEGSTLAVLHQPRAPGHFSLAVFIRPELPRTERGDGSAPLLVCSFEWTLPPDWKKDSAGALILDGHEATLPAVRPTVASGTTALRWTRFGRDANLLAILDTATAAPATIRAEQLRVTRTGNRLDFAVNGPGAPARLVSSTLASPVPLHIHRHLALVASRVSAEPGRPLDVFAAACLVEQAASAITLPLGIDPGIVRFVEIETPAAILCDALTAATAPPHFAKAYFDLMATGYDTGRAILLTIRPVCPPAGLRRLVFVLSQPIRPDPPHPDRPDPLPLYIPVDVGAGQPLCIRLLLRTAGDMISATGHVVHADGTQPSPIPEKSAKGTLAGPGFHLTMTREPPGPGEVWADISLLHGRDRQTLDETFNHFDWTWLFDPDPADAPAPEPATQVAAEGLALMTEAQARILGVSSPIAITP